jgi:hypothetical protein
MRLVLQMLLQSSHRTLDPEEADFFYVPAYITCFMWPIHGEPGTLLCDTSAPVLHSKPHPDGLSHRTFLPCYPHTPCLFTWSTESLKVDLLLHFECLQGGQITLGGMSQVRNEAV